MRMSLKALAAVCLALALSGCMATAAIVSSSLAAAVGAGCGAAANAPQANQGVVSDVCGSAFD